MDDDETGSAGAWAPPECTLPTAERPLRAAEFDTLFAGSLHGLDRAGPGRLRLVLEATPRVAGRAAELAARETACCSFFTFTLTATGGRLWLDVGVPPERSPVLDALAARAATAAGS